MTDRDRRRFQLHALLREQVRTSCAATALDNLQQLTLPLWKRCSRTGRHAGAIVASVCLRSFPPSISSGSEGKVRARLVSLRTNSQ